MRKWFVLAIAAAVALAGCSGDDDDDGSGNGNGGMPPSGDIPVPERIEDSQLVPLGIDATSVAVASCQPTAFCIEYPFTVEENDEDRKVKASISLTFDLPASDFDLALAKDGQFIATSGALAGASESIERNLGPGDYAIVVIPFLVVADTYHLVAEFEPGPEPLALP